MTNGGNPAQAVWEERWHPLREEWVIIAAHRQHRPWSGDTVQVERKDTPAYAPLTLWLPGHR